MSGERPAEQRAVAQGRRDVVPPGAASWVTPDLICDTIKTWQPYYGHDLTAEDALWILLSMDCLATTLEHEE